MKIFLCFLFSTLCAADYDCVIAGTSPFSLMEALYQSHLDNRVLILEESDECGGAWKSISVCGIDHVDLGCHQIGNDPELMTFFESLGCHLVELDSKETYFSHGCYELIDQLLRRVQASNIALHMGEKIEQIDPNNEFVTLQTNQGIITTSKLIVSSHTQLSGKTTKFYHLYLLIDDPNPPAFSYHTGFCSGMSRVMNLTSFVGLQGKQLIVIQTSREKDLTRADAFLEALKNKHFITPSATILASDTYTYESGSFSSHTQTPLIEVLNTHSIKLMKNQIEKWKGAIE
jgi:hypothetical protein